MRGVTICGILRKETKNVKVVGMKFGRYDSCMDTPFKTIREAHIQGKRVLLRVDFNVSLAEDGSIVDDTRIKKSLPTIELLLRNDNKLIIISHLGRPEKRDKENSLAPVALRLQELLNKTVTLVDDFLSEQGKTQLSGQQENEILFLENIRFYKEEQENDSGFAKKLSALGDCYVNDAFGVSHRNDASIVGIPQFLPSFMGLLLEKEVASISSLVKNPSRPFVAIIGGAKISTKIGLLGKLLTLTDTLIVGGALANTFLLAQGFGVGKSIAEPQNLEEAKKLLARAKESGGNLLLPRDVAVGMPADTTSGAKIVNVNEIPENLCALDIGPETEMIFCKAIATAKTILWNGPVGYTENKNFTHGSDTLYNAIVNNGNAFSLIGGGDTISFIAKKQYNEPPSLTESSFLSASSDQLAGRYSRTRNNRFSHISTGGGAMLELIEKGTLPGIEALRGSH